MNAHGRARYTTPLLCTADKRSDRVDVLRRGLLYIKGIRRKLRFAEVVPAPDEADLLYMLERLGSEFRLRITRFASEDMTAGR
ncbi:MAG: hypothetical protein ACLT1W_15185 [Alistipes onderdonkii]